MSSGQLFDSRDAITSETNKRISILQKAFRARVQISWTDGEPHFHESYRAGFYDARLSRLNTTGHHQLRTHGSSCFSAVLGGNDGSQRDINEAVRCLYKNAFAVDGDNTAIGFEQRQKICPSGLYRETLALVWPDQVTKGVMHERVMVFDAVPDCEYSELARDEQFDTWRYSEASF
ncbi:MAG: hypothetical protein ACPGRX_01085 [Bdellovibrionales bacterium]